MKINKIKKIKPTSDVVLGNKKRNNNSNSNNSHSGEFEKVLKKQLDQLRKKEYNKEN